MMGSYSTCCLTWVSTSLREKGKQRFRTHWQLSDAKNGKLKSQLCHRLINTDLAKFQYMPVKLGTSRWCSSYLYGAFKVPVGNALITFPIENRDRLFISLSFSVFYCTTFHGQLISKVLKMRRPFSYGTRPSLPLPKCAGGSSLGGFHGEHAESTGRNLRALLPR